MLKQTHPTLFSCWNDISGEPGSVQSSGRGEVVPGNGTEWERSEGRQVIIEEVGRNTNHLKEKAWVLSGRRPKSSIQRTASGNLTFVISPTLAKLWTWICVGVCLNSKIPTVFAFIYFFEKQIVSLGETGASPFLQRIVSANSRKKFPVSSSWFPEGPHSPSRCRVPKDCCRDPGHTDVRPYPRLVMSATSTNVPLFPVSCPALWDRNERLW